MPLCLIHPPQCLLHPPKCLLHPPKCILHPGVLDDVKCTACRASPDYQLGLAALTAAKDKGLVTRDTWEGLVNAAVYSIADANILAALIAKGCAECLTKDVFG